MKPFQNSPTIASMLTDASPEGNPTNSAIIVTLMLFDDKLHGQLQRMQYPFPIRSCLQPFVIPELAIRGTAQAQPVSSGGASSSGGQQMQQDGKVTVAPNATTETNGPISGQVKQG